MESPAGWVDVYRTRFDVEREKEFEEVLTDTKTLHEFRRNEKRLVHA